MFDIGFVEMLVIGVLGLLVLGPERLPRVARTVGHWVGRARATFNNIRDELERETHNADMQAKFREQLEEMGLTEEDLRKGQESILPPDEIPGRSPPSSGENTGSDPSSSSENHRDDNT
jgi:sec-independent protein translocase protein TatB